MTMLPGISIAMGGRQWTVPPLTLGQLRRLMPKLRQLTEPDAMFGAAEIGVLVEIVTEALSRNYPDVSAAAVENLLDLGNAGAALNAVLSGSGLRPAGEASAVAIPTGAGSTVCSPPHAATAIPSSTR